MAPRERIGQREPTYVPRAHRDYKVLLVPPEPGQSSSKRFFRGSGGEKEGKEKKISGSLGIFFRLGVPLLRSPEGKGSRATIIHEMALICVWDIFNISLFGLSRKRDAARASASGRNSRVGRNFLALLPARRIFPWKFAIFKKLFHPSFELTFEQFYFILKDLRELHE